MPKTFSARYSTAYRVYRYYFNRRGVNIEVGVVPVPLELLAPLLLRRRLWAVARM